MGYVEFRNDFSFNFYEPGNFAYWRSLVSQVVLTLQKVSVGTVSVCVIITTCINGLDTTTKAAAPLYLHMILWHSLLIRWLVLYTLDELWLSFQKDNHSSSNVYSKGTFQTGRSYTSCGK